MVNSCLNCAIIQLLPLKFISTGLAVPDGQAPGSEVTGDQIKAVLLLISLLVLAAAVDGVAAPLDGNCWGAQREFAAH